jgi:hypothetical protein
LSDEALFEYRRGLRLDPYAAQRRDYADVLRFTGYTEAYLEELLFIKEIGGVTDTGIDDAIEAYTARNRDALSLKYRVGAEELTRHWDIALFSIDIGTGAGDSAAYHTDNAVIAAAYLKDMLAHDRNIDPGAAATANIRRPSFADAFRVSRAQGNDYFLIVSVDENERDLSLKAVLYASRTGTELGTFTAYRSGENRLRNAARSVISQLNAALPFRASLIRRNAGVALIDKGRIDGVTTDTEIEYEVVKQGTAEIATQSGGITLEYADGNIAGTFKATRVDEEVSEGVLTRRGFFDRIAVGDEVILQPKPVPAPPQTTGSTFISPELQALLRTLR